jgi:hypothetical protein
VRIVGCNPRKKDVEKFERAISERGMLLEEIHYYRDCGAYGLCVVTMVDIDCLGSDRKVYMQRYCFEQACEDIYEINEREEEIKEDRVLLSFDDFHAKYW